MRWLGAVLLGLLLGVAYNSFAFDDARSANYLRLTGGTVTGATTFSGGLIASGLEANLTAGACTAGTFKVDNTTTREWCRCNDAGSAYDCISVTITNGPTD